MKTLRIITFGFWILSQAGLACGASLEVKIVPHFNNAPLVFDSLTNRTAAGQTISVTRLDFLLSGIALRSVNGTWFQPTNQFAYICAREGRTSFTLSNLPSGTYDHIRFQVGLEPEVNHVDAGRWPAGHPLNPEVNRLYWGWSHEYVFFAFEGGWQNGAGQNGFSYHIATDQKLMTIALPIELNTAFAHELQLALDVDKVLSGSKTIQLTDATDTTHSRANDALANRLHDNLQHAFAVEKSFDVPMLKQAESRFRERGVYGCFNVLKPDGVDCSEGHALSPDHFKIFPST